MIISQMDSKQVSEENYINLSRSDSNGGQSKQDQVNVTLLTQPSEQLFRFTETDQHFVNTRS